MPLEHSGTMQTAGLIAVVVTEIAVFSPFALAAAAPPHPGQTLQVTATAYCQDGKTKSGAQTREGIVAADPRVLPVGSVVRIESPRAYAGIYTVMDTGGAIDGRKLDIFIPDCARAKKFGRQMLRIRVLRQGWNPRAATPH
jgi:3D (Asp-Asp-Asp) domain-containing protein